ncbi:MAG: glycosyl hydrolase family 18 protein [Candidatus Spyradenecus sp.]
MKTCCLLFLAVLLGRLGVAETMPYLLKFEGDLSSGAPLTNSGTQASPSAQKDGGWVNYVTGEANARFGNVAYEYKSGGAFVKLGDQSASLGATAENGFTLSFHIKTQSEKAWDDFMSFCIGSADVRLERNGANTYVLYHAVQSGTSDPFAAPAMGAALVRERWQHVAIVYAPPSGEATAGTLTLYIDGQTGGGKACTFEGSVTELLLGKARREYGSTTKSAPSTTDFDEVALFDFPMSAEQVAWLAANEAALPVGSEAVGDFAVAAGESVAKANAVFTGTLTLGAGATYTATHEAKVTDRTIGTVIGPTVDEAEATLIKQGDGTLTLSGAYTAATSSNLLLDVQAGRVNLAPTAGEGEWGGMRFRVQVASGATVQLPANNRSYLKGLSVSGQVLGQGSYVDLRNAGTLELSGGTLNSGASAAGATWCGVNLPSRIEVSAEGGTLTGAMNLSAATTIDVAGSGTLTVNGALWNAPADSGSVVSTLTKEGEGTVVVGYAPTYTGATVISAGRYELNAAHTSGGAYTVAAGAMLGGSGNTSSAVNCAGVLEGGLTVGSLTLQDSATLKVASAEKPVKVSGALTVAEGAQVALDLTGVTFDPTGTTVLQAGSMAVPAGWTITGVPEGYLYYLGEAGLTFATAENIPAVKVVRAHPYLTRGVGAEAVVGLESLLYGECTSVTVQLALDKCSAAEVTAVTLWNTPSHDSQSGVGVTNGSTVTVSNYATPHYLPQTATQLATWSASATNGASREVSAAGDVVTVTFTPSNTALSSGNLWVTLEVATSISPDATVRCTIPSLTLNGAAVTPADAEQPRAHQIRAARDIIGAYYKCSAIPSEAEMAVRLPTLTHVFLIGNITVGTQDDGTYTLVFDDTSRAATAAFMAAREKYNPALQILPVIVKGGGGDPTSAIAPGHREAFVANVTALLLAQGFNGLDIDYEYCENAEQHANLAETFAALAKAFYPHGLSLSAAVNGGYCMPVRGALQAVDWLNVMAYDGAALNAPYTLTESHVDTLINNRGVPGRRLVVGMPIYGNDTVNWSQPGWNIVVAQTGFTGNDCDACTYSGNATLQTFNGPTTYRGKVRRILERNLGGVMSWGYYTDTPWSSPYALGRHQAQVIWPRTSYDWPAPAQDEAGAYCLASETDWFWFADHAAEVAQAKLVADITFAHDPKPIPAFAGELEGNGHTLTFPAQTWIVSYDEVGLFKTLTGTVRNLTIDFAGRVISRRDRKADTGTGKGNNVTLSTRGGEGANGALLAANLASGGCVEGVTLIVREGAEIRAQHEVAALVGSLWGPAGTTVTIKDCTVDFAGKLTTHATDSLGNDVTMSANADIGTLIGQMNWAGTATVLCKDNRVLLRPQAVIEASTGNFCSAGGAIGNVNVSLSGQISGLEVVYYEGAQVTSTNSATFRAQPLIANRNGVVKASAPTLASLGSLTFLGERPSAWTSLANLWFQESEAPEAFAAVAIERPEAAALSDAEYTELVARLPLPSAGVTQYRFDTPASAAAPVLFTGVEPTVKGVDGTTQILTANYDFGISEMRIQRAPAAGSTVTQDQMYVILCAKVDAAGSPADYGAQTQVKLLVDGALSDDASLGEADLNALGLTPATGERWFAVPFVSGPQTQLFRARATR